MTLKETETMMDKNEQLKIAQLVKEACTEAAREGFRNASISGLCTEGAMEAAVGAIQSLDLETLLTEKKTVLRDKQ